jgi:hypothetical protein
LPSASSKQRTKKRSRHVQQRAVLSSVIIHNTDRSYDPVNAGLGASTLIRHPPQVNTFLHHRALHWCRP